jgi:phytoene dehydrogenase-like protein
MTTVDTVDAVVVGGGHNGLVAANILADAGWDVVVLEGTPHLGGAVRSAEVAAPGYLADLCSAFYPLGVASPPLRELRLEEYGLSWTHAPAVVAHLLPDDRAAVLYRDPEATAASFEQFAVGDGKRWLAAYDDWLKIADPLLGGMLRPFPPVGPGLELLRRLSAADAVRMARRFVLPARVMADEMFSGEGVKVLLASLALHTDLSPDDAASGVFGWLLMMLGQQYGFPVPEGGAQRVVDALETRLRARGGSVTCEAMVDRVVVGNGRALGVGTVDGRFWRARRAVLCDVPAPALYRHLVGAGHLPQRFVDDLAGFRWDDGTIKVDWALSGPVPWRNPEVAGAGTVHLGVDMNGLARYSTDLRTGEFPRQPFVLAGQMTTSDPRRSPPGTESMWAYSHLPQLDRYPDEEIDAHVARMEDVFERHAPGFRDLVVGRYVADPRALQTKNPSLHNGALNAGTSALYQQLFLRPVPGLGRADTPVDRLYLAGASAHPGGGLHGAPGANAAHAALARSRPVLGDGYAALVGGLHRVIYRG